MSTIVLRSVKGSPLTNTEVDENFSNLNTDKLEAGTTATLTNKTIAFGSNTLTGVQPTLESGTNIKTINGTSLLGSGDIEISGGGASVVASEAAPTSPDPNSLWWSTSEATLKIYYDDGTSSQWVDASSARPSESPSANSGYSNQYVLTGTTTNDTETELFVGGVTNNRMPVAADTVCAYTIDIVGRSAITGLGSDTEVAMFQLKSVARNAGGSVVDVGSVYETIITRTNALINVDARASDASNSVCVYVVGLAAKTFTWRAVVRTVEV